MTDLNKRFRTRIGIPQNETITFENLDKVLEKTAKALPFENLSILEQRTMEMTKENLMSKLLDQNEGGLCYDLNSILFLFLIENNFHATLIRGVVYDQTRQQWNKIGKTHVANLINHNGQLYLVDTGFGGNLPLKPVPLNGETVVSSNGEFRVDSVESEHGDHILYMKLRYKDKDWKIGYAFNSKDGFQNLSTLNEVQKIIIEHPESPFNKKPLITRLTDKGNMILTETSFTEWIDGKVKKADIDRNQFEEIRKEYFGL
jgi:N-hydroxyarylamine O-acetyltransferase